MDEGGFVLDAPTFGLNMDLEADMSSADDLLFYLTDNQGQMDTTNGAFDAAAHLLFDDFPSSGTPSFSSPSSFSSSPSSSSPASSPPSASFSFSSSPVSSPSSVYGSTSGESSPAQCTSSGIVDADHFVFGSWIESALDTSTISPAQLQMSGTTMLEIQPPAATLPLPPIAILTSPASAASEEDIIDAGESTTGAKPPKKDTRKRKRTKKNGDEAPPQTAVTLPRDELLKLSSQELEDYAENLRKVRKLTAEEEKDLRRQRRLIKNRESAQLSRVRRREHIEVIEAQLNEVQAENARLKLQVETLTAENLQLKQHIAASSSPATATLEPQLPASPPAHCGDVSSAINAGEHIASPSLIKMVQSWTTLGKGATANAVKATYLFVILLSIGLFFNARFVHYGPGLGPLEMGPRPAAMQHNPFIHQLGPDSRLHTESVKLLGGSSSQVAPQRRANRNLLAVDDDFSNKMDMDKESLYFDEKPAARAAINNNAYINSWKRETTTPQFPMTPGDQTMPAVVSGEAANKTVLMCPTLTPLQWPGQEMAADADEITFLLPASSAAYIPSSRMSSSSPSSSSSSFSATARQAGGSMVQLTCKIVDAHMTSLGSLLVQ